MYLANANLFTVSPGTLSSLVLRDSRDPVLPLLSKPVSSEIGADDYLVSIKTISCLIHSASFKMISVSGSLFGGTQKDVIVPTLRDLPLRIPAHPACTTSIASGKK